MTTRIAPSVALSATAPDIGGTGLPTRDALPVPFSSQLVEGTVLANDRVALPVKGAIPWPVDIGEPSSPSSLRAVFV